VRHCESEKARLLGGVSQETCCVRCGWVSSEESSLSEPCLQASYAPGEVSLCCQAALSDGRRGFFAACETGYSRAFPGVTNITTQGERNHETHHFPAAGAGALPEPGSLYGQYDQRAEHRPDPCRTAGAKRSKCFADDRQRTD